jgi:C-terminal processing protease CtpA/Prc
MTWSIALVLLALVQASAVSSEQTSQIVQAIGDALSKGYIYEDVGARTARALEQKRTEGAFDGATSPSELADALTKVLQAEGKDLHLRVTVGSNFVPPNTSTQDLRMVGRVEVLAGNIGYLEVRHFAGSDMTEFDRAMTALKDVRALIIDVGRNPGGNPGPVTHLSTYLFTKPTHLVTRMQRGMAPVERWTLESVPGPRLAHVPVYVLTGKTTFSAAESFTFGLRVTGRATVVGELTGGGGHFGNPVMLPHGLQMFLPVGRAYDPRTGKGWEAEGIRPELEVPYAQALDAALAHAKSTINRSAINNESTIKDR